MDASKLEALADAVGEADALSPEAQQAAKEEAAAEQQKATEFEVQQRQWGMIAFTVGSALSMIAPELRAVYTEEACMQWGASVVPVAEKYGWSGPGNMPELGLLMTTAGLAVPSFLAIKLRLEQLREARRQAEAAAKRRATDTAAEVTEVS